MQENRDPAPPDLGQPGNDNNFATGDLTQALGLFGKPRILIQRERRDVEGYYVEDPAKTNLGKVVMVTQGGWGVEDPSGRKLAMLWRQHSEDHHVDNLSSLIHMGLHRWEAARKEESNVSVYCLANLDRTVRFSITFFRDQAILDSPSNRPVFKMAPGNSRHDIMIQDAFDDPVATLHTEEIASSETHGISFTELVDPFLIAIFTVAISLEMGFRNAGTWKSPYSRLEIG